MLRVISRGADNSRPPGWEVSVAVHSVLVMTSLFRARLEEMIKRATVDCYTDSEQACGLFTVIEESLAVPFETTVLGVPVIVTGLDLADDDQIVALVRRGADRQRLALVDLPLPDSPPVGWQWVAAYRLWAGRSGQVDGE